MSPSSAALDAEPDAAQAGRGASAVLTAVFCGFAALLPVVGVTAPKGLAILLPLTAVLAVPAHWRARRRFPLPDLPVALVLALLAAWCAVASSWSLDPPHSLVLAFRVAAIFAAGLVLFPVAAALDDAARARIGRWLVGGFLLALALMAAEIGLGFPMLRSSGAAAPGGELVWLNRGAVAMALIVWPVAARLRSAGFGRAALALPVLLGIASFFMESAAASLGLVAGIATALLVVCHRSVGRAITVAAGVLVFAGMPFAAREMHDRGWQQADWLAGSAQHRVDIWNFSAERIAEKPLLGWGFDSARHVGERFFDAGAAGRDIVSLHPHNAPLQIVLELGVVGAVIALALLWLVAARLDGLALRTRQFGQTLYVAVFAIACVAFGIWQNWWLSLIVSVALLVPLTAASPARGAWRPFARRGRAG